MSADTRGDELMNRIMSFVSCAAVTVLLGTGCQSKGGPLKVGGVEPDQGINGGGDTVVIKGAGFVPGKTQVEIRFGRARAEQVSIASANEISVVTPPGDKGPVDVTLMFDSGEQFKIAQGFRYVLPGGSDDVRSAYFGGKPGQGKATGAAPTNTTPPPPPK
jgi:IPT/TIG domain